GDDDDSGDDLPIVDVDGDGVAYWVDCDDSNPDPTFIPLLDADCDGVLYFTDCDDNDSTATTTTTTDSDCDGVLAADDCDDNNAASTVRLTDADCDGVLDIPANPNDVDGDGFTTAIDCDDSDPTSTIQPADQDCDGVLTPEDCNDGDPAVRISPDFAPDCTGSLDCGGPNTLAVGQTATCDLGAFFNVTQVVIDVGCGDSPETGEYLLSTDNGYSATVIAECGSTHAIPDALASRVNVEMLSGGGTDEVISWNCCGSGAWSVQYR
ncbi:MAG TPA: hypothetical protein DIU15_05260, partial [Deltaproteobacteria bacterium]|nr:hypothetical protein [Deltaproteobacteria bacterium]